MYLIKYEVIINQNTKTLSKKLYGTKNDTCPSVVSITSSKGYSSLVCKIYEIFTQANFNE